MALRTSRFAELPPEFWAKVDPEPLEAPYRVAWSPEVASLLGIDDDAALTDVLAGRARWPGAPQPIATRYAGHQFGVWVRQLGDGRALVLGEVVGADGRVAEVQVKGSGRTPWSRGGDGRAALRSTVREFLASEAMAGLGIPTTRALAIVGSDEPVYRERVEPAAILCRVAPSHVRFGHFEVVAHEGRPDLVQALADHVIAGGELGVAASDYVGMFGAVVARTASLIAAWQGVGFTHGVMNSDNMSILGLTIDYGPYAFVEGFEPQFVPNHSDHAGRYALGRQPAVALWNLGCLAEAILPLIGEDAARAGLQRFGPAFAAAHQVVFAAKLGLARIEGDDDDLLLGGLFRVLAAQRVDWTTFWRALSRFGTPDGDVAIAARFEDPRGWDAWAGFYRERLAKDGRDAGERRAAMDRANPRYVLRTHLAQRAIEQAEMRDFSEIEQLRKLLGSPFDEQPEHAAYAEPPPAGMGVVELSCSS